MDEIKQKLLALPIYIHWYANMLELNAHIDSTKVSKHQIHHKDLESFINGRSWNGDGQNALEHWKSINCF